MGDARQLSRKSLRRDQVLEIHFADWPEPTQELIKLPGLKVWWQEMKLARERDIQSMHRLVNNLGIASTAASGSASSTETANAGGSGATAGPTGPTGPTGPIGLTGVPGLNGIGVTGPTGPTGAAGATGPTGPTGASGSGSGTGDEILSWLDL